MEQALRPAAAGFLHAMKRPSGAIIPWALGVLGFAALIWLASASLGWAGERELLRVETAAGGSFPFHVEIADTASTRARGLMFRQRMEADHGMLFVFDRLEVASFWMKNTPLALDLLFIGPKGVIRGLHRNAVPYSTRPMISQMPVLAVLEVLAGTASRLGIRSGDRIRHRVFANAN